MSNFYQKKDFLSFLSFLFIASCILSGCSSHPFFFARHQQSSVITSPSLENNVKIVDSIRLKDGGSLYIVPFLPGPGVDANTEVNKVALMVVKGLAESLKEGSPSWKIISSEQAQNADIILNGHITRFDKTARQKKWIFGKKTSYLEVSGRMMDQKKNSLILHFRIQQTQKKQNVDFSSWGYDLGRQIGKEILDNN